ncbi:hypothetical protein LTR49_022277 [Elasticomyces elasticus]|nr:hypothetical protein LTR49_022277 [Elasticomyces elasticus]KAK5753260.1 hypothetical protein LTS12_016662 [Elasticomyces elasticus]
MNSTAKMCYYDNYKYQCNDWKWGNFRQHCKSEYRQGETCGMKMVYQTLPLADKCTMCEKIERKQRRLEKHKSDYQRWAAEPKRYKCSMEKAMDEMEALAQEIQCLIGGKQAKYHNVGNLRRA